MNIASALAKSQPVIVTVPTGQKGILLNNQSSATIIIKSPIREVLSILPWLALTSPVDAGEQLEFRTTGSLTGANIDLSFSESEPSLGLVPISNIPVEIINQIDANIVNAVIPVSGNVNAVITGNVVIDTGGGAVLVNTSPTPLSDVKLKSGPGYTLTVSPQIVWSGDVSTFNGIRFIAGTMLTYWQLQLEWWDAAPGPTGYHVSTDIYDVYSGGVEILDYCFVTKAPYLIAKALCTSLPSGFDHFDIFGERGEISQGASRVLAEGNNVNIVAAGTLQVYLEPWYGRAWVFVYGSAINVNFLTMIRAIDYTATQQAIPWRRSTAGLANDALQQVRDFITLGRHYHRLDITNNDAVARAFYYSVISDPP